MDMHNLTAKEIERVKRGLPPWESMSFACGGWLQFYLFGVAKGLQEYGFDKDVTYLGCSAGALAAAGLAFDGNFDDAVRFCKEYCLPKAYGDITGLFRLSDYVSLAVELCILPGFRSIPKETLQIAVTKLPLFKGERIVDHPDREELILTLLASAAAFPFAPLVNMKSGWYVDGGVTDFQPIIDEETITVSPLYFSDCHIKPSRYVPLWWSFMPPKSSDTVDWIYNLGFEDCSRFLQSKGLPLRSTGRYSSKADAQHPYNEPRKVSMHRFLGYDLANMTNQHIAFVMDLLLLMLLVCLWKPLALLLIYIELFVRIIVLAVVSCLVMVWDLFPPFLIQSIIKKAYVLVIPDFVGLAFLRKHAVKGSRRRRCKVLHDLWECFTCVGSLSLLLRFISGPPSVVELRKHNRLAKYSVLYRLFRHII